jgi:hypothetical protein
VYWVLITFPPKYSATINYQLSEKKSTKLIIAAALNDNGIPFEMEMKVLSSRKKCIIYGKLF